MIYSFQKTFFFAVTVFFMLSVSDRDVHAQEPASWIREYAGACIPTLTSNARQLADGSYIFGGQFGTSADFCVTRVSHSGDILSQRSYGGSSNERWMSEIEVFPDGGFGFAGGTASFSNTSQQEGWLFRTNSEGSIVWQKRIGSVFPQNTNAPGEPAHDELTSFLRLSDGSILTSGRNGGATWFVNNAWFVKLDENGNVISEKLIGIGSDVTKLLLHSNGNVVALASNKVRMIDQDLNVIWEREVSLGFVEKVRESSDGNIILLAADGSSINEHIIKLDALGNIIWQRKFDLRPFVEDLSVDDDGMILVGRAQMGGSEGANGLIIRLDNNGEIVWQRQYDGGDFDEAVSVSSSDDGGFFIVAIKRIPGIPTYENRTVLIKMDRDGNVGTECPVLQNANYSTIPGTATFETIISATETVSSIIQNTAISPITSFPSLQTIACEGGPSNNFPTANAGPNISILSSQAASTTIEGSASDPDEYDDLECRWLEGTTVLQDFQPTTSDCPLPLVGLPLALGQHTLTLEVTDGTAAATDDMILSIDNTAPTVAASGGGTYEIGSIVSLGAEVSDYDGDLLEYLWEIDGIVICSGDIQTIVGGDPVSLASCEVEGFELGNHTATIEVTDGTNEPVINQISIDVVDNSSPTLAPVANRNILWPPNHEMVDIIVTANAEDNSGVVHLTATVSSNEPIDGTGDGDTAPDWTQPSIDQTLGIITLQLRAERSGSGNGRIYSIVITATDAAGNASSSIVGVKVPHSKGKK